MRDFLEQIEKLRPEEPLLSSARLERSRAEVMRRIANSSTPKTSRSLPAAVWGSVLASLGVAALVVTIVVSGNSSAPGNAATGNNRGAGSSTEHGSAASPSGNELHQSTASPPVANSQAAATILRRAAARLRAQPNFPTPNPNAYYYLRSTLSEQWLSIDGERDGKALSSQDQWGDIPGCKNGHIVGPQAPGNCGPTIPTYLSDAPTEAGQWDRYLDEHYMPQAIEDGAGGYAVENLLSDSLLQPDARAALLQWIATLPGLSTTPVASVDGQTLLGVTCASLQRLVIVFAASDHHLAGTAFNGQNPAEVWLRSGVVKAVGERP